MFLLLRAKESGLSESEVLMLYILFNLIFAISAFPLGKIADRMNKVTILSLGLGMYAFAYLLMALQPFGISIYIAFCLYGLYYAFTQGIIKVLLLERVSSEYKSNAIGFYDGINSLVLLLANALAGIIWYQFGAAIMLAGTGLMAALLAVALFIYYRGK